MFVLAFGTSVKFVNIPEEFDPKHGVSSEKITKIPLEDDGASSKRGERTLPMQFHLDHSPLMNPSLFKQYSSTLA